MQNSYGGISKYAKKENLHKYQIILCTYKKYALHIMQSNGQSWCFNDHYPRTSLQLMLSTLNRSQDNGYKYWAIDRI